MGLSAAGDGAGANAAARRGRGLLCSQMRGEYWGPHGGCSPRPAPPHPPRPHFLAGRFGSPEGWTADQRACGLWQRSDSRQGSSRWAWGGCLRFQEKRIRRGCEASDPQWTQSPQALVAQPAGVGSLCLCGETEDPPILGLSYFPSSPWGHASQTWVSSKTGC